MLRSSVLTAALLMGAQGALAQPSGVGAGAQLRQIPPVPTTQATIPDIRVERREAAAPPALGGPQVMVRTLHVTGQTRFSEAALIAASGVQVSSTLVPGEAAGDSDLIADNRITYGCINVPVKFFEGVVKPAFTGTSGVVYILPEIEPMQAVFPRMTQAVSR
jgi:hypothetical protein